MRYELHTDITIDASAERVWSVLTDFARYPEWNPFVLRIGGELRLGAPLNVDLQPPQGRRMTIRPRVTILEPGQRFAWRGTLIAGALFAGEHRFEVGSLGPRQVRMVQAERFSGLLVPLVKKMLDTSTRAGFEAMNRALKQRAESGA